VDYWKLTSGSAETFPAALANWYADFVAGWFALVALPLGRDVEIRNILVQPVDPPGQLQRFPVEIGGSWLQNVAGDGCFTGLRLLKYGSTNDSTQGFGIQCWRGWAGGQFRAGQGSPVIGAAMQLFARQHMVPQSTGAHTMRSALPKADGTGYAPVRSAWFELSERSIVGGKVLAKSRAGVAFSP